MAKDKKKVEILSLKDLFLGFVSVIIISMYLTIGMVLPLEYKWRAYFYIFCFIMMIIVFPVFNFMVICRLFDYVVNKELPVKRKKKNKKKG